KIGKFTNRHGAETMAASGHRSHAQPAPGLSIVDFIFDEGLPVVAFAARNEDEVPIERHSRCAPGCGKGRRRLPGICRWVVDVVHAGIVCGGIKTSADRVDSSINHTIRYMITGFGLGSRPDSYYHS